MSRLLIVLTLLMLTVACVPHRKANNPETHSLLFGNFPIIRLDGEAMKGVYEAEIQPGKHQLVVKYPTLTGNYQCYFTWQAELGAVYEIVADKRASPLTIYQWKRTNALWASRSQGIEAEKCEKYSR